MNFYTRFIRTHIAKTIPENKESIKLQKEYSIIEQRIAIIIKIRPILQTD